MPTTVNAFEVAKLSQKNLKLRTPIGPAYIAEATARSNSGPRCTFHKGFGTKATNDSIRQYTIWHKGNKRHKYEITKVSTVHARYL